jgi:hypothetical protein
MPVRLGRTLVNPIKQEQGYGGATARDCATEMFAQQVAEAPAAAVPGPLAFVWYTASRRRTAVGRECCCRYQRGRVIGVTAA